MRRPGIQSGCGMRDSHLEGHGDLPNRMRFMKVLPRLRESRKVCEDDEQKQEGRAIRHTFGEFSHLRLVVWRRFGAHATQSATYKSGAKTQFANPTGRVYFPSIQSILEGAGFLGKRRGQAASRIGQALNSGQAGQGKPHRGAESHWQRTCSRGLRIRLAAPVLEGARARQSLGSLRSLATSHPHRM